MQLPVPFSLTEWNKWLANYQTPLEAAGNKFGEINETFLKVRRRIEAESKTDVDEIASLLLPLDTMLQQWHEHLPLRWMPQTVKISPVHQKAIDYVYDEYEVWEDHWIASMWNYYHLARVILYTDILSAILNNFSVDHLDLMQRCFEVMKLMTLGTVRSVPYHLGYSRIQQEANEPTDLEGHERSLQAIYLLIWPFFVMGGLRTTSAELRAWVARTLDKIAIILGNQHARSLAEQLRTAESFERSELWAYTKAPGHVEDESEDLSNMYPGPSAAP